MIIGRLCNKEVILHLAVIVDCESNVIIGVGIAPTLTAIIT